MMSPRGNREQRGSGGDRRGGEMLAAATPCMNRIRPSTGIGGILRAPRLGGLVRAQAGAHTSAEVEPLK